MVDASKYPKAARLQQQREEKYAAEQERLRAARDKKTKPKPKKPATKGA